MPKKKKVRRVQEIFPRSMFLNLSLKFMTLEAPIQKSTRNYIKLSRRQKRKRNLNWTINFLRLLKNIINESSKLKTLI